MKNDSCLTVSRRAAIIRQDAEENYGTLLTLGESMRRAYQVEELIDRMRWDNADFCLQRTVFPIPSGRLSSGSDGFSCETRIGFFCLQQASPKL